MIWVTWRQHRAQILVTAGFLALLGLLLLGSAIEANWHVTEHAPGCPGPVEQCLEVVAGLFDRYDAVYSVFGWMPLVAPALIGAFWGAPLLGREYERGTHRLAWTQGVPVRRWLVIKLSVLGGAVVAGGLLLSLMVSLWRPVFKGEATPRSATSACSTWSGWSRRRGGCTRSRSAPRPGRCSGVRCPRWRWWWPGWR
ncbi:hypothetical protein ACFQYP_56095 [Nonomuraea antimicrobica]